MIDDTTHTHNERPAQTPPLAAWIRTWLHSRGGLVTLGLLAVALVGLAVQRPDILAALLPYALFVACPLMMLFMHGSHGGHGDHNQRGGHS